MPPSASAESGIERIRQVVIVELRDAQDLGGRRPDARIERSIIEVWPPRRPCQVVRVEREIRDRE